MSEQPDQLPKPDLDHLEWQVDRRSEIQRTLLAIYRLVRDFAPSEDTDKHTANAIDDLVSAAFSLWRAVFLAETNRDWTDMSKSREEFLISVVTDNAISYNDDKKHRAWTVGYYLRNAKLRLSAAYDRLAERDKQHQPSLSDFIGAIRDLRGTSAPYTRYEWEFSHQMLCQLINLAVPKNPIPVPSLTPQASASIKRLYEISASLKTSITKQ